MPNRKMLSQVFSRTASVVLALFLMLAWCGTATSAAPKRVGNAEDVESTDATESTSEDAPAATDDTPVFPDVTEADGPDADATPADPKAGGPKKVGNVDDDMPADADSAEGKTEKPDELLRDPQDDKTAPPTEPEGAKSDGAKSEESATAKGPASPTKPASKKAKEKKGKDFVGKLDQRKNDKGMYRFESGAYIITTDVDKALANDIAAHMDEVYKEYFARLQNFRPNPYAAVKPNEKMPLYVTRRYRDYLTLLKGFGFNAANSGGVFFRSREGSGLATWVEGQSRLKMYYVLQHEGFHQFADARLMGAVKLADGTIVELPPWVNEGLAEYFGDAVMVKKKLVIGRLDRERLDRMKRAIKQEITLPFYELMTMDNDRWVARVTAGDKASSLMYDSAWSVCYFLIHGNKKQRFALETYLKMLNDKFVTDPSKDPRLTTFRFVFGNNLDNFEAAWRAGVSKMEPDAWFTSVRHLQWMAAALKEFRDREIEVKSWDHLKEQLIRHKFKATIRERDIVARGERKEQVEHVEQDFNFPDPAQPELIKSNDPRLPHGMVITHITPNIVLSWSISADGVLEEDISYVDPPKGQIQKTKKKPAPAITRRPEPRQDMKTTPKKAAPRPATESGQSGNQPAKKGTIKVGPQ